MNFFKKIGRYFRIIYEVGKGCLVYVAVRIAWLFYKKDKKNEIRSLWLVGERGFDARDNGYLFYRFLLQKGEPAAYLITKDSPDYPKVAALGGKLIRFNSFSHYVCFFMSRVKISTHIMGYAPKGTSRILDKWLHLVKGYTVLLNHGVIKDVLPVFFEKYNRLDLFVSSTIPEYRFVLEKFGYTDEVIKLCGLPRFDIWKSGVPVKKRILIMPTFRRALKKVRGTAFEKTEYFRRYAALLQNERLVDGAKRAGYEICFYPHVEMQDRIQSFRDLPLADNVKILDMHDSDIQELLLTSAVMITDFSSVAFDFAFMKKPVVYFPFDYADFRKKHYAEGYFDYGRDGFGPVYGGEWQVAEEICYLIDHGVRENYLARMNRTFPELGSACENIYGQIQKLLVEGRHG